MSTPITRLNGFSSGLDIDELVRKMVKANSAPLERLQQQKQLLEWKREDYRTVNTKFMDFRNTVFNMKLTSSYMAKSATSSDSESVSVTGTAAAVDGSYQIKINSLASAATITSGDIVTTGAGDASKKMTDLLAGFTDSTLTIGGAKGTATIQVKATDTIANVVSSINAEASYTGVRVSYDETLDKLFFSSSTTGADSFIDLKSSNPDLLDTVLKVPSVTNGTTLAKTISGTESFALLSTYINEDLEAPQTFTINYEGQDYDYTINDSTTIAQLIDNINSSDLGKAGVSAYLNADNKLTFFVPDETSVISFSDEPSDDSILTKLGLATPQAPVTGIAYETARVSGTNAVIDFNNGTTGTYQTNTFTINGIQFTAKKVTTADVNISVSQDVDKVFENIKGFVDKYNELIATVNTELLEQKYRDFQPLTPEQKDELSEEEIKKWEEKARSGTLRRDSILSTALVNFRTSIYDSVQGIAAGDIKHLTEIGISTGITQGSYEDRGKLYIDEAKLRKALSENPDQVMNLFIANDNNDDSSTGDGIASRLYSQIDRVTDLLLEKAGASGTPSDTSLIAEELKNYDERIRIVTDRITNLENRYYRQFTAMETALSQLNNQSAYFMSQMNGG